MKDLHNPIPLFEGQTLHSTSNETIVPSVVDDQGLDRQTLTRTLTGNRLLEDAHPRMHFTSQRPRARSASTSICLPEKAGRWVAVPQRHEDTPISTFSNQDASQKHFLLAKEDDASGILSLEEVPSIAMSYDDPTASLTTLLPTPCRTTGLLLPHRCIQVSQPKDKLQELRQKLDNEQLYETLVQKHGVCREEHPVTRRLSTSYAADSLPQVSRESSPSPRLRRKSTSAYQPSTKSSSQLSSPKSIIRTSSILGPITLSSPATPRDLCMAAIAELEETQDILMEAWSRCCQTRQSIPPIKDLWNALYNFTYVINLFTALTATKSCTDEEGPSTPTGQDHDWVRPEIRAKYMKWRTPIQAAIHRSLGIGYNGGWAENDSSDNDDDEDFHDQQQEIYPLTPKQLKDLARVCFEASNMLRPLAIALKALLPHQRELIWAEKSGRWSLYVCLKTVVQEHIDECVRIARCPLMSWLRNARNQACEALGLDVNKVPGSEKDGEDDGREVQIFGALQEEHAEEVEIGDEESMCGVILEPGEVPRQVRTRIMTLKAQYYFFCLLSARCSLDKLDGLAAKVTNLLLYLEISNIGDALLREELRDLRRSVMRRVEKAERAHRRRLGLMDSVIQKITRPTLHERMTRNIKAGRENVSGMYFLNDIGKLFARSARSTVSSDSRSEESMSTEDISAEDLSVGEVETEVKKMSPLHRC